MRNLGLDLMRFAAIFLVLGRHLNLTDYSNILLKLWHRVGWIGVDLFFVLSGFLVSSLMFREHQRTGRIDIKRFLIRRGFKIYPAFWLFLFVSIVVKIALGDPPSTQNLLGELLFLQNYLGGIWDHTWSLAVEEHFYLGIAILFGCWAWFRPEHRFSAIPFIFLMIALACLTFRLINAALHPDYDFFRDLAPTHLRIDSLFFGVLLSYLYFFRQLEQKTAWIPTWLFFLSGLMLLSPAFLFSMEKHQWVRTVGVIPLYLGSGLLLLGALRLPDSASAPLKFFGLLGAASYSIYLWHMPVNVWGWDLMRQATGLAGFPAYFLVYVAGSCLFGLAMNRAIEYPVLRIRDFLFPSVPSEPRT